MEWFFSEVKVLARSLQVKGSFARNFAVTFSGNSLGILAGLLFTPFIARIYTPEGYGAFAVYMAIVQNGALAISLQFSRAFVLPEQEAEFKNLYMASLLNIVLGFIFISIAVLLLSATITETFNLPNLGRFIYLLPVTIFLYALNDVFKSWNLRYKFFQRNASNQVLASATSRSVSLVYGILTTGNPMGLILGDTFSKLIENFYLGLKGALRDAARDLANPFNSYFSTLKRFRNYPLFILPGIWLLTLAGQMPVFFAARWFSTAEAGNYSFASSLLNMPVALLAGAISPVFLQKASEVYNINRAELPRIVKEMANKLFYVGLLPILVLTVFGDVIFRLILGSQWTLSGQLAGYLGIHYLFFIVSNPLMTLYRIYRKEYLALLSTILLICINLSTLGLGYWYGSIHAAILFYSLGNVIFSLLNIARIFSLVSSPPLRTILTWIFIAALGYVTLFSLRRLVELML